jgi:apolipoprotein N-acyltransferase
VSAVIDPRGRVDAKTSIFKEGVLNCTFGLRKGETLYVRFGDWFVLLCFLFLAAAAPARLSPAGRRFALTLLSLLR